MMKLTMLTIAALMAVTSVAQAAQVQATSATFTGTVFDFNFDDSYLATLPSLSITGPLDLGNGVTFYSSESSEIGAFARDLQDNGLWSVVGNANRDGYFIASDFNRRSGSIDFEFSSPMQSVGIFVNQNQIASQVNNALQVLAYDVNGYVLESFTANVDTAFDSYDEGMFLGFQRQSADIYSFSIAGNHFVVDNLTVTAVPEPEAYAMFLAGLSLLGAVARRKRS